jgi:VWFA-related protein
MHRTYLAFIVSLLAIPLVAAQLKVEVQLVNVVATVTDDRGRYVSHLTQDDLIIEEDGKVQEIVHFSQSNDLPVSMGIVLDTSGSMERKISTAVRAVERFIRMIHEDDDIFLLTFSNRPDLRQDFTDDREKLAAALRRVTVGGGTSLYDALDLSLRKIKRGTHDKKAILLISDGEDTTSETTLEEVTVGVRESELLVYSLGISPGSGGVLSERTPIPTDPRRVPSIGFPIPGIPIPGIPGTGGPRRFPVFPSSQRDPRQIPQRNDDTVNMTVLNTFADASGGKTWRLSGNWSDDRGSEIQRALDEIANELRNQYSIGYYPSHPVDDGKWHRIQIRAKNKQYRVRARKEYFGK